MTEVAELERMLGDPADSGRLFSYAHCGELDDREEFPLDICRELDFLGVPRHYVPHEYGGDLRCYPDSWELLRAVSRRDLTVAVAHGKTFLGAVSVWVGGSQEQARALAARVTAGAVVSWGLSERDHGSDLLSGEVTAHADEDGYRIDGEKWLINNASRGHLMCVLARTGQHGIARGFSVLLVDKQRLDATEFRTLPGVRLHGIRGADISGIRFTGARVPADALVGAEGDGVEIVLKSLQLTRTLCTALSLGATDHALGLVTGFALERHAYGHRLIDLPQTRRLLAESFVDALLTEAVSLVAVRSVHALPAELGISAAAVKYLVPTLVDQLLTRLSVVLGARSMLVGAGYEHGRFQKVIRDHRIVGIFDGSTVVNLHALINHFGILSRRLRQGMVDERGVAAATTLAAPLADFDRTGLSVLSRGGCSLVQSLPAAMDELVGLADAGVVTNSLGLRAKAFGDPFHKLAAELAAYRPTAVDIPTSAFNLADRYARCYAAAAATQLWLRNRAALQDRHGLWARGLWLEAVLARLLDRLVGGRFEPADDILERVVEPLVNQHRAGDLLSLRQRLPRKDTL
jgi:alkylation response protein AidB-like acyl-CoA dehydrogenase